MRVVSLIALVCAALSPTPAVAQQAHAGFCSSTPVQMLSAIEGQWTFKQGMGVGIGVVIPFPLPPHPPQSVRIDVDEARGFATLRHAGQEMAIVPIAAEAVEAATRFETERFLDEADAEGLIDTSGGCQWVSLPLMLGSNTYQLKEAAPEYARVFQVRVFEKDANGNVISNNAFVCNGRYIGGYSVKRAEDGQPDLPAGIYPSERESRNAAEQKNLNCKLPPPMREPREGQLVMNLLVKFNGPDRGTGILLFAGEMDGYRFAARAPVALTR